MRRQEFTARRSSCWRSASSAPPGNRSAAPRALVEVEAHLGELRRVAQAEARPRLPPGHEPPRLAAGALGGRSEAPLEQAHALVVCADERAAAPRAGRRAGCSSKLEQVLVEAGRAAHRLAGVVDQQVQARRARRRAGCRRSRRSASGAGRGRGPAAGRPSRRSPAPRA